MHSTAWQRLRPKGKRRVYPASGNAPGASQMRTGDPAMRKLSLSILAASIALSPSGAFAQGGPPMPPPGGRWQGGMHGPNVMMRHMGPMQGRHFQRLRRGFVVPSFWFGPQFQIGNWQMYGFADPGPDGRWIRYYDD